MNTTKNEQKRPTVGKAKSEAWKAFSSYIKLRDAIATTGTKTECECITCGKVFPVAYRKFGAYIQAGHGIDGRAKNILFDEQLVNGQCSTCNCVFNGRLPEYAAILIALYGNCWFDEKLRLARLPADKPWRVCDLEEIKVKYEQKLKEL